MKERYNQMGRKTAMIYRLGMIGLWDHTGYTLDSLAHLPNVKLVACTCNQQDLLNKHRKSYPFFDDSVKIYHDFHEMLEKEALDIAVIHTTHGERCEAIIAALQAGAHIFSEKPLCSSLADLPRIQSLAGQLNVQLSMMLNMRFGGVYRKVREIVEEGVIGEVVLVTAQKSYKLGDRPAWMYNRGTFAGTIPYIACHSLDLIRWCGGLEFVKGAAFQSNVGCPQIGNMENSASMILLAENGATISSRLDYCRPENAPTWGDDRLRIAGRKGIVEVMNERVTRMTSEQTRQEIAPLPDVSQFDNFLAAIEGREKSLLPAADCYRITEVVLKLRDAADRGIMTDL